MSKLMGETLVLPGECPHEGLYCCKRMDRVRCCSTGSDSGAMSAGDSDECDNTTHSSECEDKSHKKNDTCLRCIHF